MRPPLVGESNPYGADPRFALYPAPDNSAGHRLCTKIMQIPRRVYVQAFERVNLCPQRWSVRVAAERADYILRDQANEGRTIVLLGKQVATSFHHGAYPSFSSVRLSHNGVVLTLLPHPSGLCRTWNIDGAFERAHKVLTDAGVLPVPQEYYLPRPSTMNDCE